MYFADLHQRLIRHIRHRLDRGEITERGLARQAGLSQSHLHNVLKGARSLSNHLADRLLRHLEISVLDLLAPEEQDACAPADASLEPLRETAYPRRCDRSTTSR
jgi:transcriptional regulator with XRE-family HTH domain